MFPFEIFPIQLYPREIFPNIKPAIIVSLIDNIIFTQDVSLNNLLNRTISQSLTFTQDATLRSSIKNVSISDSLIFTQNISVSSPIKNVSVSDFLVFIQDISTQFSIRNVSISDSLTFTQNVSTHFSIRNLFVTQSLFITDSFVSNHQFIYDTLNFVQSVSKSLVHHKYINQSLIFIQDLEYIRAKVRRLKDRLIFTQSLSVNVVRNISIIDRLEFKDALSKANKSLNISLTQVLLFKGGGGYHSDAPQITKTVDSTTFIYSDVIALKVQKFIVLTGKTTIILPSPLFGDSRTNIASLNPLRMVDGTVFTYVKTTNRQKLTYKFELKRQKAAELQKFLDNNDLEWLTMDNFKAERWMVRITNNPIIFTATGRGYLCPNNREVHQVSLEMEGFRVSGAPISC